jgi:enamine deaminase RidA (YjgF/YER057c/UK114 family)
MSDPANKATLPSSRLITMGLVLPDAAQPQFNYVPVVLHGDLAYVSGQLPKQDGDVQIKGRVGDTVSLEAAQEAARICAVQALACLAQALGSIDRITRIIRLSGFVASGFDFYQQPVVIDAASELMVQVFGEAGRHARSAIGVSALPRNSSVELEVIAAFRSDSRQ